MNAGETVKKVRVNGWQRKYKDGKNQKLLNLVKEGEIIHVLKGYGIRKRKGFLFDYSTRLVSGRLLLLFNGAYQLLMGHLTRK